VLEFLSGGKYKDAFLVGIDLDQEA